MVAYSGDPAQLQDLVARGQRGIAVCTSCHTFEAGGPNRIGPNLHDVFGRRVATHAGFDYSGAMQAHGGIWTYDTLNEYLRSPAQNVRGTKMAFAGIRNTQDRVAVIAYSSLTLAESAASSRAVAGGAGAFEKAPPAQDPSRKQQRGPRRLPRRQPRKPNSPRRRSVGWTALVRAHRKRPRRGQPLGGCDWAGDARDAGGGRVQGLDGYFHMMRVGVKQTLAVEHHAHMPLPEDQVAASEPGQIVDGQLCSERRFLHVSVTRRVQASALQRGLNKARTINSRRALAAPEIWRFEEELCYGCEVLRPRSDRRYVLRDREAAAREADEFASFPTRP